MEVVINGCFGGFGISNLALLELIKMNSKIVAKQTFKKYYGSDKDYETDKVKLEVFKDGFFSRPFSNGVLYDNKFVYYVSYELKRNSPDLIKVVKKLKEKANGHCAELKIVEIPDGVDFVIDEYDGIESIHEKHESWN